MLEFPSIFSPIIKKCDYLGLQHFVNLLHLTVNVDYGLTFICEAFFRNLKDMWSLRRLCGPK